MEEDNEPNNISSVCFENGYFAGQMDILHSMEEKLEAWIEADDSSLTSEQSLRLLYADIHAFKTELHSVKSSHSAVN